MAKSSPCLRLASSVSPSHDYADRHHAAARRDPGPGRRGGGPRDDAEGLTPGCWTRAGRVHHLRAAPTSMENVARARRLADSTLYAGSATSRSWVARWRCARSASCWFTWVRQVEQLPTIEERLVEAFVAGVQRSRADGLLTRLLKSEPETVLPYFTRTPRWAWLGRASLPSSMRRSPGHPARDRTPPPRSSSADHVDMPRRGGTSRGTDENCAPSPRPTWCRCCTNRASGSSELVASRRSPWFSCATSRRRPEHGKHDAASRARMCPSRRSPPRWPSWRRAGCAVLLATTPGAWR